MPALPNLTSHYPPQKGPCLEGAVRCSVDYTHPFLQLPPLHACTRHTHLPGRQVKVAPNKQAAWHDG